LILFGIWPGNQEATMSITLAETKKGADVNRIKEDILVFLGYQGELVGREII